MTGGVILADRCIYDTLVDLAVDTGLDDVVFGPLGHWLARRLPAPHLAVVLNRPVAAIRADRPDVLLDRNFARRRALYRRLAAGVPPAGAGERRHGRGRARSARAARRPCHDLRLLPQRSAGAGSGRRCGAFPLPAPRARCLRPALTGWWPPGCRTIGRAAEVVYIARRPGFLRFYLALWVWFWRCRGGFADEDVFHFHRNYAAWPKLLLAPRRGRVIVSYHNVTGRVLEGWLGRLAAPVAPGDAGVRAARRRGWPTPSSASAAATGASSPGSWRPSRSSARMSCPPRSTAGCSPRSSAAPPAPELAQSHPRPRPDQPPEERAAGRGDPGGAACCR